MTRLPVRHINTGSYRPFIKIRPQQAALCKLTENCHCFHSKTSEHTHEQLFEKCGIIIKSKYFSTCTIKPTTGQKSVSPFFTNTILHELCAHYCNTVFFLFFFGISLKNETVFYLKYRFNPSEIKRNNNV